MPTFAGIGGYDVPSDRIIDGVDQSDLFFSKNGRSKREGFPVYNGDDLYAYKWRNWKVHFVELNSMFGAAKKLNIPYIYNLIKDPKEDFNIAPDSTWILPVVMSRVMDFQKTLVTEPPIRLGTRLDRITARAAVGGEFPNHSPFRDVRRVPNSAMTHVSVSPRCHPGRSDFPSPVGDHDFPPQTFPLLSKLKRWLAYTLYTKSLSVGSASFGTSHINPGAVS